MEKLTLNTSTGTSQILIDEKIDNLDKYIKNNNIIIITDKNVYNLYKKYFSNYKVIIIEPGEQSKDIETVLKIYHKFLDYEVDRYSFIVGIGGGVVTDITGFTASTFMRGIPFGFVATTLLAQVDAAIGGKNGIDFAGYKNMVGIIRQPNFIICDFDLLKTLPKHEFRCGIVEAVKHSLIKDYELFTLFEQIGNEIYYFIDKNKNFNKIKLFNEIITKAIKVKANVVQKDDTEKGERKILNFGHTIGHSIEAITGINHGDAVSIGIDFALKISLQNKFLSENDLNRIIELMKRLDLKLEIDVNKDIIINYILKDKKRIEQKINFILISDIGNAFIKEIEINNLKDYINNFFE